MHGIVDGQGGDVAAATGMLRSRAAPCQHCIFQRVLTSRSMAAALEKEKSRAENVRICLGSVGRSAYLRARGTSGRREVEAWINLTDVAKSEGASGVTLSAA